MFKKLLDMLTGNNKQALTPQEMQREAILSGAMRVIEEQKKVDPLIGAKIASIEIRNIITEAMKTERGVHIESLLCALGSLAGYSCQASLRTLAVEQGKADNEVFNVVNTVDGKQYFFGDALNEALISSQYSLWSLSCGAAQELGLKNLPDLENTFKHVARTVGNSSFGKPVLPDEIQPHQSPAEYLIAFWPVVLNTLKQYCLAPSDWPIALGLVTQDILLKTKGVIDTSMALRVVMESAIPMSKIDMAHLL